MNSIIAGAKSMVSAKGVGQIAVVFLVLVILAWLNYGPERVAADVLPPR